MRVPYVVSAYALAPLVAIAVSCEKPMPRGQSDSPTQVSAWTGRPGILTEWGHGAKHIYGVLAKRDSEGNVLVVWEWQGPSIKETSTSRLPESMHVVPAIDGICGLSLDADGPWPYAIIDRKDNSILKKWDTPAGWSVLEARPSMNGKFIALIERDNALAPDYKFKRERAKVGVIDVAAKELKWVAQLTGSGVGTVRRIAVTDDGRYVAIAGWDCGTAMVDAKESRVLWAKRPEHEVGTGYAAFAPKGRLIYTGGAEGCVYGIEVANGNVVSQRWATKTGKSIYGYRISALAISNDGKWLAAGTGPEGHVYVWNLEQHGKAQVLEHGGGSICVVAFSPDAKSVVSVGGGDLKVWQVKTAR